MVQPAQPVRTASGDVFWTHSRLILWVVFACFLIAALVAGGVVSIGTWQAWALGGVAAWFLSGLVP
jgi:hypothetical protein